MNCEICAFRNPRCCVTAIILKDNRLLVFKRNQEPYKDAWDLPGGYVNAGETLSAAIKREVYEETGIRALEVTPIENGIGSAEWKGQNYPISNQFYLVDIGDQKIVLNDENKEYTWIPLEELTPDTVCFDTNQGMVAWIKFKFTFDLKRVRELVSMLDASAVVKEQALYKAILNGFVATEYIDGQLAGMGWAFRRQTMLRNQAVVEDMIVDEAYRGKGLGKKIMLQIIDWAKNTGVEVLELTTGHHRIAAGKLYESVGFKLHDTRHMLMNIS